jgi:hypothetical protein
MSWQAQEKAEPSGQGQRNGSSQPSKRARNKQQTQKQQQQQEEEEEEAAMPATQVLMVPSSQTTGDLQITQPSQGQGGIGSQAPILGSDGAAPAGRGRAAAQRAQQRWRQQQQEQQQEQQLSGLQEMTEDDEEDVLDNR